MFGPGLYLSRSRSRLFSLSLFLSVARALSLSLSFCTALIIHPFSPPRSTAELVGDAVGGAAQNERRLKRKLSSKFIDVAGREPTEVEMDLLVDRLSSAISKVDVKQAKVRPPRHSGSGRHSQQQLQRRRPGDAHASLEQRLADVFEGKTGRLPSGNSVDQCC